MSNAIAFGFHVVDRIGEIKGLQWESVDWENKRIRIEKQLLPDQTMNDDLTFNKRTLLLTDHIKGHCEQGYRYMDLTDDAMKILKRMEKLNPSGAYIFMRDGRPLTTQTYNRHLRKFCLNCGIKYRESHKIRFTSASTLYKGGMSTTELQKLLGHTNQQMTLHYLRNVTPDEETRAKMQEILG